MAIELKIFSGASNLSLKLSCARYIWSKFQITRSEFSDQLSVGWTYRFVTHSETPSLQIYDAIYFNTDFLVLNFLIRSSKPRYLKFK